MPPGNLGTDRPIVVIHARPSLSTLIPICIRTPPAHLHVVVDREPKVVVHTPMQQQHTHKVLVGEPRAVSLRHVVCGHMDVSKTGRLLSGCLHHITRQKPDHLYHCEPNVRRRLPVTYPSR